ncbi:MAG: M28 family metallopeptidase [Flavobacteriaceae bacterium]|jgi:Zn-dependent M28 family amino/carboxypeptidase
MTKSVTDYASSITSQELQELLYVYASDYFEGRETGTPGQKKAIDFLTHFYSTHSIQPAKGSINYLQPMALNIKGNIVETENVVAIIKGSEFPDEYIVISSHLDHVGIQGGEIHNGADDDGSGTVALLEIAEAFQTAVAEGQGPKRSIVFLHVTGEEKGLLGSKYYTDNPLYPLSQTMVNLNIDMVGRLDPKREDKDPRYVYLIGSDKLSLDLHEISETVNQKYMQYKLDYTYNDDQDPNRFYYRSDHYNFAKNNIPVIFYFNGTHDDYHRPSDTPEKINYPILAERTQLIFYTAWELANRNKKITLK